jgi:hypothetical protein
VSSANVIPDSEGRGASTSSDTVGFVRTAGRLDVRLPKAYGADPGQPSANVQETVSRAALLARVMAKYRREAYRVNPLQPQEEAWPTAEFIGRPEMLEVLDAAASLRSDFLENGLYVVRGTFHRTARGAATIDWPRTMRRHAAFMSDDAPVYFEVTARERLRDPASLILRLHATALSAAMRMLGDRAEVPETLRMSDDEWQAIAHSPREMLEALTASTFRERGLLILRLIEQFLGASSFQVQPGNRTVDEFCLTHDFEMVWEAMLRSLLQNVSGDALPRLPRPLWFDPSDNQQEGARPRIDGLRLVRRPGMQRLYLLFDAKDKPISTRGARSGTPDDHYKQIVYRRLLPLPPDCECRNVLFFPSLRTDGGVVARVLGRQVWTDWSDSEVWEVSLDFPTVARAYLGDVPFAADDIVGDILREMDG